MHSYALTILLAISSGVSLSEASSHCSPSRNEASSCPTPSVDLENGTYVGVRNEHYSQDFFLGIPYAQPPIGSLRFAPPLPLTESFDGTRSAAEYGLMCIGYGSDTSNLGNPISEDCLTLNVVRPEGTQPGDDLPVGVWVHGGSYVMGGSRDPRYNLSNIVAQSTEENKPMVAVSINYRLSYWGFLFSGEMQDAGAGNVAFRDQRMALRWLQENIAAFGGSPDKITIWGESAGARSLGMQLVAYDGNHDDLFRSAILESGSPIAKFADASAWQPYFDALVQKTGCDTAADRLSCLRELPWQTLSAIFNGTTSLGVTSPSLSAVIDGDFMTAQASQLLRGDKFAHVPLLLGNNFDEGTAYAKQGINTTEQFKAYLTTLSLNSDQVETITELYPDDPAVGIPASYTGRPAAYPFGLQWKRVAAFAGDYQQHSGRRLLAETYAAADLAVYSYMWNVYVNGIGPIYGATHFQEVAFVFDNTQGAGYAVNPFENKPQTFVQLADLMSKLWVAFTHANNPNLGASSYNATSWPRYTLSSPDNLVFDVNHTDLRYVAKDDYRSAGITYLQQDVFV
ncbi:Alpha/Beta hydrolase protein [Dactylonectria macrodidyma]|uniref:Carboxylic ester hydrolase n=1 Tax=Dactylonectria macrodidyma TaxID=307937 RepID=A0A9P9ENM6_9HYPO|nr:Alpha/Beta hydrolase protein [Dactylonectria macrodidyma]